MDFEEKLRYALERSVFHRERGSDLFTFGATRLPYFFAARSALHEGETVVRRGEILTERPAIMLGHPEMLLEGFGESQEEDRSIALTVGRRFHMPALRYENRAGALELIPRDLEELVQAWLQELEGSGNTRTAVISAPEDAWPLPLLIYAGRMMQRSLPGNLRDLAERGKLPGPPGRPLG